MPNIIINKSWLDTFELAQIQQRIDRIKHHVKSTMPMPMPIYICGIRYDNNGWTLCRISLDSHVLFIGLFKTCYEINAAIEIEIELICLHLIRRFPNEYSFAFSIIRIGVMGVRDRKHQMHIRTWHWEIQPFATNYWSKQKLEISHCHFGIFMRAHSMCNVDIRHQTHAHTHTPCTP